MARVLVVEDEAKVRRGLQKGLEEEGYEVVAADNGDAGFKLASSEHFDCLVLDLMLPGRDGLEILRELRTAGNHTPTIILTARGSVADRVQGLDGGADDYLPKPFAFAELLARIRVYLLLGHALMERIDESLAAEFHEMEEHLESGVVRWHPAVHGRCFTRAAYTFDRHSHSDPCN